MAPLSATILEAGTLELGYKLSDFGRQCAGARSCRLTLELTNASFWRAGCFCKPRDRYVRRFVQRFVIRLGHASLLETSRFMLTPDSAA
jgi:hypothetical protein